LIAFLDMGAYQDVSASNFNALPRPAMVMVNGCNADIIKRAESIEDVFSRDQIPERLIPNDDEKKLDLSQLKSETILT